MAGKLRIAGVALLTLLTASVVEAVPVDAERAAQAAGAFVRRGHTLGIGAGRIVESVREHRFGATRVFSVRMCGGGTVFVADDTEKPPIVAMTSSSVNLDEMEENSPLRTLLSRDAQMRDAVVRAAIPKDHSSEWEALAAENLQMTALAGYSNYADPVAEVGDVRVPALVQSKWDQLAVGSRNCYNYYTPSNSYCGCVATAMAQLMRYHRYPDSVTPTMHDKCWYDTTRLSLTTSGDTYDWDRMPLVPNSLSSDEELMAVGRICSDAGIAAEMQYSLSGSGTYSIIAGKALKRDFRYAQAAVMMSYVDGIQSQTSYGKMILSNLDAGLPVILGIAGSNGGHEVIADGYGYVEGCLYVHLNMGWSGQNDIWYNLPNINENHYYFTVVGDIIYNIMPSGTGAVLSGRVALQTGDVDEDAMVTVMTEGGDVIAATNVSSCGTYAFILPAGNYSVCAVSGDGSATGVVQVVLSSPNILTGDIGCEDPFRNEQRINCEYVSAESACGNSWGNDITLDAPEQRRSVHYVSSEMGVDLPENGTMEYPFASIQYAIEVAELRDGDEIRVMPGTYYGCVETPSLSIRIVSTDGPEVTTIDAERASCCYYGRNNEANVIAGFTLENGYDGAGGGVLYGYASNCVIRFCAAIGEWYGGGGAYCARLVDCVLYGNEAYWGGGSMNCTLQHCTVYDNWAMYGGGGVDSYSTVVDSIVWRNTYGEDYQCGNWERDYYRSTTFSYSCTYPAGFSGGEGCITNDPCCISFDFDDWRLYSMSPCLLTASDGRNMGAWQGDGLVGHSILVSIDGYGEVNPIFAFVFDGENAAFEALSNHPLIGFYTNGVFVSADMNYVWEDVRSDGELTIKFGITNIYVSAAAGDDAGSGTDWDNAKRTLEAGVLSSGRGDTIYVAPGTYAGTSWASYGVRVLSVEGHEATVIDGGNSNLCVYGFDMYYRGFTLVNGYRNDNDCCGGGAYYGTYVDCIISNCTATAYGGGAAYATLTNCLVVANRAEDCGGGVFRSYLNNCTVAGNSAAQNGGGAYLDQEHVARNTIVAENSSDRGFDYGNDIYGLGYYSKICSISDEDAGFVDSAKRDYRLKVHSKCIDAGTNEFVAVSADLSGTNRVYGSRVDIGCYEYHPLPSDYPSPAIGSGDDEAAVATKVQDAMKSAGFSSSVAEHVSTLAEYNALSDWAAANGISKAEHVASPVALLSAAIGATSLLTLSESSLVISEIEPSATGARIVLSFAEYNAAKANPALLKAAVGIVGASSPTGDYSTDGLDIDVRAVDSGVEVQVVPPEGAASYFFRSSVR